MQANQCDVFLVQSILVDVYWKDVKDLSAWRKIGSAIRMGYQMRWHKIRTSPLPRDRYEARLVLVRDFASGPFPSLPLFTSVVLVTLPLIDSSDTILVLP